MTAYPIVEKLITAIKQHQISFEVQPADGKLEQLFYRRVMVTINDQIFSVPVMEEYEDIESGNPVVLLHLVLQECVFFEEAEDILIWAKDVGLNSSDKLVRQIYLELRDVVPAIRKELSAELEPVPAYDIEFNTGIAIALCGASI